MSFVKHCHCKRGAVLTLIVLLLGSKASAGLLGDIINGLPSLPGLPIQFNTRLQWDPSPSPSVVGYAVYYRVLGLPVTSRLDVGNTLTASIPLLLGAASSVYVVAYNQAGVESEGSNLIEYAPPPLMSLNLAKLEDGSVRIQFRTTPTSPCRIEWTETLNPPDWQQLGEDAVMSDANGNIVIDDPDAAIVDQRYYRAVKL
jgi:hypothetical protein